ncbi:MAG TPA: bifunctional DNA primase/polymerase, partial [Allocoleopsis sp.]
RRYLAAGFSLIPCKYKKPLLGGWEKYQLNPPTLREVNHWFEEWEQGHSIGLLLGAVSHNVIAIDLDGMAAARLFKAKFPHLLETRIVFSGSRTGFHLYYRVDTLPTNMKVTVADVGNFEIRGNGQYVIAPPSPHLAGFQYQLHKDLPIKPLANMNEISDWFNSLRQRDADDSAAAIVATAKAHPAKVDAPKRKEAFLRKLLSEEVARVATSSTGNRNNSLFYAGLRLANYAAGGELAWGNIESMLMTAAISVHIPENEARNTIASAWRIGSKNPKQVK